jgi:hypothetical protein
MIFARLGDKKANKTANYSRNRVFVGVSEIKCIIFIENNDNPY